MRCPFCHHKHSKVVDSRAKSDGRIIRRRRECFACERRFTTKEYIEETPILIIKSDLRREAFSRKKLKNGIMMATAKRPISLNEIDSMIEKIENELKDKSIEEIPSKDIGLLVMNHLKKLDHVAYVRFASVYRNFKDKEEFLAELEGLR